MHHDQELTGNDYVCLPSIGADGTIDDVNALHAGLAGLIEWSGDGAGRPLFRLRVSLAGAEVPLTGLKWRHLDRWIPAFSLSLPDGTTINGTICAPGGYPAVRGFFIRLEIEQRGRAPVPVDVSLDISWQSSRLRIASARTHGDTNRLERDASGTLVLAMDAGRGPALAIDSVVQFDARTAGTTQQHLPAVTDAVNGALLHATVSESFNLTPQRRASVIFYVGAGREPDGARQSARGMRRTGADALLRQGRLELSHTMRPAQDHRWAELLNRNLMFCRYYSCGRAIDDDRLYLLRSRHPSCPAPALANEREALLWALPAITIADPGVGREALLRQLEIFSERSGEHRRYIDGGVFDSAFSLDQFLLYAWAIDRYMQDAQDETILLEPLVQQVLLETDAAAYIRLHPQHLVASTDVLPSGDPADYPFTTISNVLLWWFAANHGRLLTRNAEDPQPRFEGAAGEVAAAIWQHCVADVGGRTIIASSADLEGNAAVYDDPAFSLSLLPYFGFCPADDPVWRESMEFLRGTAYPLWRDGAVPGLAERADPKHARLAALCADLLVLAPAESLDRLQRIALPGGVAAAAYDPGDGAASETHHAALAGFLAWSLVAAAEPAPAINLKKKRRP